MASQTWKKPILQRDKVTKTSHQFYTTSCVLQNQNGLQILQNLKMFRTSGLLTDVAVCIEDMRFNCHKVVLSAASPYFKALFEHSNTDTQLIHTITLETVSASGFMALEDYIYGSELNITLENVVEVLEAADFLQFREVVEVCSDVLLQHIDLDNCIAMEQLGSAHMCQSLADASYSYIISHMEQIQETHDFRNLSVDVFQRILSDDKFIYRSHVDVVRSICRWVKFDVDSRSASLDCLVKGWSLTIEQFQQLLADYPFVAKVQHMLIKEQLYDILDANPADCVNVPVIVPRDTVSSKTSELYYLDMDTKQWCYLTSLPFTKRSMYSVSGYRNCIYVCGGEEDQAPTNEVMAFDERTRRWSDRTPMLKKRYNHSSAVLLDRLYVVGGMNVDQRHLRKDAEEYNAATDQWTRLPNLLAVEGIGRCAVVPLGEYLHVLGGVQSTTMDNRIVKKQHMMCQYYDPHKGRWEHNNKLSVYQVTRNIKIGMGDCLAYRGLLLIIDEDPKGRRTKIYNPVTQSVEDFTRSHGVHRFGGYIIMDDNLYCTGGMSDKFRANDLVHYKDITEVNSPWQMGPPMVQCLSHHACIIIALHNSEQSRLAGTQSRSDQCEPAKACGDGAYTQL